MIIVMKDSFLKLIFNIMKIYLTFTMIYPSCIKEQKLEKLKKIVANLHDQIEYDIHIRNLKQALNHRLVLKKAHRVTEFKQKVW